MTDLLNGNMYEVSQQETYDLFAPFLDGAIGSYVLVVGETWPNGESRNALEKSFAALGYGSNSCAFAALADPTDAGGNLALDANALYALVEGLDPLCVVATDEAAAGALGRAYRTPVKPDSPVRLFGRNCVAFRDFAALMGSPEGKQRAWALLKSIPHFSS